MAHLLIVLRRAGSGLALLASGALIACVGQGPEVFDKAPPSPAAEAASWPRLADIPPAPPAGVYTNAAPDIAKGAALRAELAAAAAEAERRRSALQGPVE